MIELIQMIVLGLVQGLTEFLPVSSSGHLVLVEHFMNMDASGASLEVALHGGTLVSVLVYYRRRIGALVAGCLRLEQDDVRYAAAVVIGSLPAMLGYALFKDAIEAVFDLPHVTALMLCVTGAALLTLAGARGVGRAVTLGRALLIGLAQAVALVPGVSRSGSTIVAARHGGIGPEAAAEFSFLLSIPALCGALLFKGIEAYREGLGGISPLALGCGVLVAGISGYLAIRGFVRILCAGKAWMFGAYCLAVGILGAWLLWPR